MSKLWARDREVDMKSIMLSVQPKMVAKILNGEKTIEIRKTKPNCELPVKVYIYFTKGKPYLQDVRNVKIFNCAWALFDTDDVKNWDNNINGQVVAEFTLNKIDTYDDDTIHTFSSEHYANWNDFQLNKACIHEEDFENYANDKWLYGWHITDLKIYDESRELGEFRKPCISPNMPYCPSCPVGCATISDSEAEAYREFGECDTEWCCLNWIKKAPSSWCYVEES